MDSLKSLRWIIVASLLAVVSLPAISFLYLFPAVKHFTVETSEKRMVNTAYQLAGHFRRQQPVSEEVPLPASFVAEIERVAKIVGLFKVKVFTPEGVIVYSTQSAEIGNHTGKDFFPEVVGQGVARSLISEKELPNPDGSLGNRLVLETYVPLVNDGRILGAFEIYYDMTDTMTQLQEIVGRSWLLLSFLVVILLAGVAGASFFARRNVVQRQAAEEKGHALEARLLQARKMEAVGTLVGGLVHDVNNILTSALAHIGMAERKAADNGEIVDLLGEARGALKKILDLLTELRGIAVTRRLRLDHVETVPYLGELLAGFSRYPEVTVAVDLADGLPAIEVDKEEMGHVIRGIVLNGIQAMNFTGTLTVKGRVEKVVSGNSLNLAPGRYLRLSIIDQGTGIAQADIDRIFDPYFTTKEKGSQRGVGLGLSYCYATILQHGGQLEVESTPGQGSSFHIWIPVFGGSLTGDQK